MSQYLDAVIPFHEFSIRIGTNDIPQLPAILSNLTDVDIARLQVTTSLSVLLPPSPFLL